MDIYSLPLEVRWSDLDPNFHLRHSVYYDYGAYCRLQFLDSYGLTAAFMAQHHFGPILFREEAVFRREIRLGDQVRIDLHLMSAYTDYSRWTIQHHLYKNEEELSAIITVDGAWIDTQLRKLATPNDKAREVFEKMPTNAAFQWTNK